MVATTEKCLEMIPYPFPKMLSNTIAPQTASCAVDEGNHCQGMLLGFGALGGKIQQMSISTDHESIQSSENQHKSSGVLETVEILLVCD